MTRRVTPLALLLAALAAATVAPAGAGAATRPDAQPLRAAAFDPLTERSARRIATRLVRQVARERRARWWQLSPAIKVRSTRVVFQYGERIGDQFCTARVRVEQTRTLRRASLIGGRCRGVPGEALAIERSTSALIRAAQAQWPDVVRSVRRYTRELRGCERLVVPRNRRDDVRRLLEVGEAVALLSPLLAQLDAFVIALERIQPRDPELAAGVDSWRRLLTRFTALPAAATDACTAVREWAAQAYAGDAAPVDFEELRLSIKAIRRHEERIAIAAARLFDLGVSPRIVVGITPEGIAGLALAAAPPWTCANLAVGCPSPG